MSAAEKLSLMVEREPLLRESLRNGPCIDKMVTHLEAVISEDLGELLN